MARTSSAAVQGVLLRDYDTQHNPVLTPYIDTASAIVDRVAACAIAKGKTLAATELELLERWLAAHFYKCSDQQFASKSTDGASASYTGKTDEGIRSTKYGQTAIDLDASGCLSALAKQQRMSAYWLGKSVPEQISYEERNR